MARTNFSFKKRQQEIERKKKQDEKRQRKQAKKTVDGEEMSVEAQTDGTPISESEATDPPNVALD